MNDVPQGLTAAYFSTNGLFAASGFYDAGIDTGPIKTPYFTLEMAEQICREMRYEKHIAGFMITDESITYHYFNIREEKSRTDMVVVVDGHKLIQLGARSWPWMLTHL